MRLAFSIAALALGLTACKGEEAVQTGGTARLGPSEIAAVLKGRVCDVVARYGTRSAVVLASSPDGLIASDGVSRPLTWAVDAQGRHGETIGGQTRCHAVKRVEAGYRLLGESGPTATCACLQAAGIRAGHGRDELRLGMACEPDCGVGLGSSQTAPGQSGAQPLPDREVPSPTSAVRAEEKHRSDAHHAFLGPHRPAATPPALCPAAA